MMEAATKELAIREPNWAAPDVPLPIESDDDYVAVAGALKVVKDFEKRVEAWFKPLVEKAHATWKGLTERRRETLAPAKEWEGRCKTALATWDTKKEQERLEEEWRLAAEAQKAEEQRRLKEAAALEQEAIAEGDESKLAEAQQLIEEPIETPVVMVPKTTPKVSGVQYREQWDAKVVDLGKLIQYVAQNPNYQNLLTPNATALRQLARSLKDRLQIPGVKAYSTKVVASR